MSGPYLIRVGRIRHAWTRRLVIAGTFPLVLAANLVLALAAAVQLSCTVAYLSTIKNAADAWRWPMVR